MEISIKTIGIEFTFDTRFKKASERVRFYRELYGYRRYSNYSRYVYLEEGILSDIPYLKQAASQVIVSVKNAKKLRKFLKNRRVVFNEKIVILNKEEAEKLGLNKDISNNWEKIYEELKGDENLVFRADF